MNVDQVKKPLTWLKRCQEAVEAKKKSLGFLCNEWFVVWHIHLFKRQRISQKGDTGVSIKGRLYRINFIKVDGELKYQAKRQDEQGND